MSRTITSRSNGLLAVSASMLAVFIWLVGWYWPTASQIAEIWQRSDTYAHGMVVIPVFAWLIWRKRSAIDGLMPEPVPWMAIPVALMGFAWLLGRMVNVDGLTHFGLIGMIAFTSAGVLGRRLVRVLLFPLIFLFFGLPIGDFLIPILMHYTAEFTVLALRLSGVPVFQEGLFFVIPTGRWSVVEACSGLRYMHATLFVGALYAYLNYVSLRRRLLFMLVALIVPILANWVRAYLTVMIGHLFGDEFVRGFIHLVYGWVFFGVVILLLFWIGSRWREDAPVFPRSALPMASIRSAASWSSRGWLAVVSFALVTAGFPLILQHVEKPVVPFAVVLEAPPAQSGWEAIEDGVLGYLPNYSGHRGELFQAYRRSSDHAIVGLYVAYYADQRDDTEMVAWQNRLRGREGIGSWVQMGTGRKTMPVGPTVNALLRRNDDNRLAVWYWYWINQRVLVSDVVAKMLLAADHLTGRPDDAAFVAVYAPYALSPDEVQPVVEDFIMQHAEAIETMLRRVETER